MTEIESDRQGRGFRQLSKVGLRLVTLGLREQVERREQRRAEQIKKMDEDFQKRLTQASEALADAVDGDGDGRGGGGSGVDHEARVSESPPPKLK